MQNGEFAEPNFPETEQAELRRLGESIERLALVLRARREEMHTLTTVTRKITSGLTPGEVLDHIYESFHNVIPYDRIGFAVIENGGKTARSAWVRTSSEHPTLDVGYTAPLRGSSLQELLKSGEPRIIADLEQYLARHPDSDPTRRMVGEGMRSNLTCLLTNADGPMGFLFFSSLQTNAYESAHVDFFQQIAGEVCLSIEKARLYQGLKEAHESLGLAVHDLRNPLAVIRTYLAVARRKPEAAQQLLTGLEESVASMVSLIDDVLDFSRMGSGKLALKRLPTSLEDTLSLSRRSNSCLAEAKGITLKLEVEEGLPELALDRRRMSQVLNNLLSNAFKFSLPGTTVVMGACRVNGEVEVYVRDQGPGIQAEEAERLFRPFVRARVRPTGGESSTGLGLVICKWIVEAHGGTIRVHSVPGEGSTFSFTLPGPEE